LRKNEPYKYRSRHLPATELTEHTYALGFAHRIAKKHVAVNVIMVHHLNREQITTFSWWRITRNVT